MSGKENKQAFLGTLRSELDDDPETGLHGDFEILAGLASTVRSAYLSYRISPEKAAELFRMLRLKSADGQEWTVGATHGAWYARPAGSSEWHQSVMPVGVEPADGDRPDWLTEGVAKHLAAAETATPARQVAAAPGAFSGGTINPFQRKDNGELADPVTPRRTATGERGADVDLDWLYEEWEGFDSQLEQRRKARSGEPAAAAMPAELPADLQADHQLAAKLQPVDGPAARDGADFDAGAPTERNGINPEDFFLR